MSASDVPSDPTDGGQTDSFAVMRRDLARKILAAVTAQWLGNSSMDYQYKKIVREHVEPGIWYYQIADLVLDMLIGRAESPPSAKPDGGKAETHR